jgi:hypothetical protein
MLTPRKSKKEPISPNSDVWVLLQVMFAMSAMSDF